MNPLRVQRTKKRGSDVLPFTKVIQGKSLSQEKEMRLESRTPFQLALLVCSMRCSENTMKVAVNNYFWKAVWEGEVLGDWERANVFWLNRRTQNYSAAALKSNATELQAVCSSHFRALRRWWGAASADFSGINHVKPRYFHVEQGSRFCGWNGTNNCYNLARLWPLASITITLLEQA